MLRGLAYVLFAAPVLAQSGRPVPQQAPVDALIQSYQSAYSNGKFDEAAAARDQARALLNQIPVDDPQFANWVQRVSGIYENGGFALRARDVLEQALARAGGLGDSSPTRVALLDALSRSWEQDRNLLKSVSYLEQAVAATESQAPRTAPASGSRGFSATGSRVSVGAANYADLYQRLYSLYRRLGRPEDAAAVLTRIAAHVKNSDGLLASLYQQSGQIDEAAAIYKRQAAEAADPQQAAAALQSLAGLYQGDQRYGDAVAALQQAIGKTEVSSGPAASIGMRQSLANMFQQAGQVQAGDQVYQQLMAGQTGQQVGIITNYANFLEQTNRVDQAETLLNDYQANHASEEPGQQSNLMMALANVERLAGKPELADEYQRRAFPNQLQPAETGAADTMQRFTEAVNAGKLDEAFNLTLQAIESAHGNSDLNNRVYWMASVLASRQAHAKADEIYRRTAALAESWSAATVAPLLNVEQNYANFLQYQGQFSEFEQAVERYRATLTAARGAGTGWLEDVMRLHNATGDTLAASQELVALEESLSGATSEPYLHATETLAGAMVATGDRAGALPLRRKMVTIADLVYNANDSRRATVRVTAAMAYAREGQFDEAETFAREAVAISQRMQPPQPGMFTAQLQQILQMKQAAQLTSASKQ
jgi:tetratricopeptide (TPR) repeat protein